MESVSLPEIIFAGPGKTASTWIYQCLCDHPDISAPNEDSVEFFSSNFHRGWDWYNKKLGDHSEGTVVEMSNGYFSFIHAPSRIAETIPEVDLIFTVRNPIDRAYSNWWHGRGDKSHNYEFENVFDHYPKFEWWVRPGFYHEHISRYLEHFSEEQIHLIYFDDLVEDDLSFIQSIYSIIGVNQDYVPAPVDNKTNTANRNAPAVWIKSRDWLRGNAPEVIKKALQPGYYTLRGIIESESQYERGMDPDIRRELEQVYVDDVRKLESMTGKDFNHWFEFIEL